MTATQTQLLLAALAVPLAFFCSVWVNAITRASRARAEQISSTYPSQGELLVKITHDAPVFLASLLLVMLVFRVSSTVLVTAVILRQGWPAGEAIAIALATLVLFELIELAPRTWVLERLDQVLVASARPVYIIGKALGPIATVLVRMNKLFLLLLPGRGLPKGPLLSEEEIKSIVDVAQSEEVIEADEREMIHSIFEFTDTVVREVMVPRPDMVCVDVTANLQEVLDLTLSSGFSRIPVINQTVDDVVGIIYQKDVVKRMRNPGGVRGAKAGDVKREATFVPEPKRVSELLREMQHAKTHMAIVVDEYGGVAGLATMEDLLEEIVGEISDEYDREDPAMVVVDNRTIKVSARMSISELSELLGSELPRAEWDSVGGLVGGILGRLPKSGDVVRYEDIEFEVDQMKGRRIWYVLVRSSTPAQVLAKGKPE